MSFPTSASWAGACFLHSVLWTSCTAPWTPEQQAAEKEAALRASTGWHWESVLSLYLPQQSPFKCRVSPFHHWNSPTRQIASTETYPFVVWEVLPEALFSVVSGLQWGLCSVRLGSD
jgi:hypothetical protein